MSVRVLSASQLCRAGHRLCFFRVFLGERQAHAREQQRGRDELATSKRGTVKEPHERQEGMSRRLYASRRDLEGQEAIDLVEAFLFRDPNAKLQEGAPHWDDEDPRIIVFGDGEAGAHRDQPIGPVFIRYNLI